MFIDPIGTGFSRASKPELGPKFWGVEGDLDSVGEFVRMYISRNERWNAPLFVAGESYGTTRAAALSERLLDNGIALNGVLLISSVLNFATGRHEFKGGTTAVFRCTCRRMPPPRGTIINWAERGAT